MKSYKFIATDLDGTIIPFYNGVSKKDYDALEYLHSKKIDVAISTGRNFMMLDHKIVNCDAFTYIICCNGSLIYKNHPVKLIYQNLIKHADLVNFIKFVKPYVSAIRILYVSGTVSTKDPEFELFANSLKQNYRTFGSITNHDDAFLSQISFVDDIDEYLKNNTQDACKVDLSFKDIQKFKEYLKIMETNTKFYSATCFENSTEVTNAGVTKGQAILQILKNLNLSTDEALAFGDSGNDLTMANIGIDFCAMGNSSDDVKEKATMVTDTCAESGFSKMIYKIIK